MHTSKFHTGNILRALHPTGEPDGSWTVDQPAEEVPAELPEPCLGINFARDGMLRRDWLALVAVHSDAWLLRCVVSGWVVSRWVVSR